VGHPNPYAESKAIRGNGAARLERRGCRFVRSCSFPEAFYSRRRYAMPHALAQFVTGIGNWRGRAAVARLVLAGFLVILAIAALPQAWREIAYFALTSEENAHILLVPFIVGWIVWARRHRIWHATPRTTWLGPVVIAIGFALALAGYHHAVQAAFHLGAVLVGVGALLTPLGTGLLLAAWPACLALLCLVPIPGTIRQAVALPLQELTAAATASVAAAFGMTVEQAGNLLVYNDQRIAVAEACNGLRMVSALSLVIFGFCFTRPLQPLLRAGILIAAPVLAVICNIARLIPTVWLFGHYPETIGPAFHEAAGWVMLLLALVLLLTATRSIQALRPPMKNEDPGAAQNPATGPSPS